MLCSRKILLRRLKTKIITKSRKELLMDKRKLVAVGVPSSALFGIDSELH